MFSESYTGSWAELQLPCCPSKQGELPENMLQNLLRNLPPQTVLVVNRGGDGGRWADPAQLCGRRRDGDEGMTFAKRFHQSIAVPFRKDGKREEWENNFGAKGARPVRSGISGRKGLFICRHQPAE